ncbi:hydroxypyruvate reductase [Arboricoccus pini]|uniref:Hydroxypyruvate reductase n=1 Tax=Arboricoccus pini TaxID=1963835 RepID=A0A212S4G7_9PROT|nr:glycerate kinase [Arboricoccus pini]SNB80079.1 hydroxypyruvate reductase [Arboricoccus pini]
MSAAWSDEKARSTLRAMFDAAVAQAAPGPAVLRHLPAPPKGRCIVVGAGKASAAMAAAVDAAWPDVDLTGVVVTRYGHAVPAGRIRILEAAHPVPDEASERAAHAIMAAVQNLGPDDLVIALMSGGGSALLTLPPPGMTLADKRAVNKALLLSGATISEMNAVRRRLSAIKGGRLALAARPARVLTLLISDVPGDDPAVVASGPTVPDQGPPADVDALVARLRLDLPPAARQALAIWPPPPTSREVQSEVRIIAAPSLSLEAAAETARQAGLTPLILGDALEGEARELGTVMSGIARSVRTHGQPLPAPTVLLSGGETTVTIGADGHGKGGRNTEFLLGLAVALQATPGIWAMAGDSDGIDGSDDAAGAFVTPDTLARGREVGHDARQFLKGHDSYSFFDAIGDLIRTGPTLTNVNDIRAIMIT